MSKRIVQGIAKDTLMFILEISRSSMPNEFAGLLQAENGIITNVLILPGTETSRISAMVRLYMLPNMSIVGSVHSHPSSDIRPSHQDLLFFSRTGEYHIIVGPPFDEKNWNCYDILGNERNLSVLDIEFNDNGFNDSMDSEDYMSKDEADT
ncbi:MAG: Mov34/MPN/PAD-1 family protein [Methanotrichaceae archaeon]|nr:Mov34/MPN/PAD-1 family protein [Methanotrichaceae archaeon]